MCQSDVASHKPNCPETLRTRVLWHGTLHCHVISSDLVVNQRPRESKTSQQAMAQANWLPTADIKPQSGVREGLFRLVIPSLVAGRLLTREIRLRFRRPLTFPQPSLERRMRKEAPLETPPKSSRSVSSLTPDGSNAPFPDKSSEGQSSPNCTSQCVIYLTSSHHGGILAPPGTTRRKEHRSITVSPNIQSAVLLEGKLHIHLLKLGKCI
ncbi:uncharacterized protein LOC118009797 [Mirounga leonina]|uniref:uncharacterized protein LOC118009797 n=1 Tax=Mirounga leonina TaxID=9715 RepID=UPI00156C2E7E|nr:uncharacterized protein LOC118009797 [Mirounga leonina]